MGRELYVRPKPSIKILKYNMCMSGLKLPLRLKRSMSKGPNRVNYESKSQVSWLKAREERRLRMLRRIFGPRMGEVKGEWRKLHNGELNDLYSSPSIAHVIKSRRMRRVTHSAHIGAYRVLVGKPERDHLGDPGIDGMIILRWIFRN